VDVGLSELGREEAATAGEAILASGIRPTLAFTSLLARAGTTLDLVLERTGLASELPVTRDWRLNERHYGALTGLNKAACVEKWGAEQVAVWRRSYATAPAAMEDNHPLHQQVGQQPWVAALPPGARPRTESLRDLVARTVPYWTKEVEPRVREGHTVLCVAHGTSLRGVVKHMEGITDADICRLDLPNGIPIVYR
jgi:2,3-bisphosphoglycerate-dependent phosphoglycerate mutase